MDTIFLDNMLKELPLRAIPAWRREEGVNIHVRHNKFDENILCVTVYNTNDHLITAVYGKTHEDIEAHQAMCLILYLTEADRNPRWRPVSHGSVWEDPPLGTPEKPSTTRRGKRHRMRIPG